MPPAGGNVEQLHVGGNKGKGTGETGPGTMSTDTLLTLLDSWGETRGHKRGNFEPQKTDHGSLVLWY